MIMGFIWGLFKTIALICTVVIAALVVIDGTLLANLLGKNKE
jgi:hypothetical protein